MSTGTAGILESLISGLILAVLIAGVRFALVIRDTVRDVRYLTQEVTDLRRMHRPTRGRHQHQHQHLYPDRPDEHRER